MKHMTDSQGLALPTVLTMLALTSMAALLAWRNLWVNDQLLNAEADLLRTQHKAQAVLPVALADIVGNPSGGDTSASLRHTAGDATQSHAFFPQTLNDYDLLRQRLTASGVPCSAGICAPVTLNANATQASHWKTQTATAVAVGAVDSPYGSNTAWYWVEVFPRANTTNPGASFVYRITTLATGVLPGSSTVLQAIWTRQSDTAPTGQWHSWHVLHD